MLALKDNPAPIAIVATNKVADATVIVLGIIVQENETLNIKGYCLSLIIIDRLMCGIGRGALNCSPNEHEC